MSFLSSYSATPVIAHTSFWWISFTLSQSISILFIYLLFATLCSLLYATLFYSPSLYSTLIYSSLLHLTFISSVCPLVCAYLRDDRALSNCTGTIQLQCTRYRRVNSMPSEIHCSVLKFDMLSNAVQCDAVIRCTSLCCAILWCTVPCCDMPLYAMLRSVLLCHTAHTMSLCAD